MSSNVHPTAIIERGAEIDSSARVGAYAYVGPMVRMGSSCVVHHHATVEGNTTMGSGNEIYPYAFIGARTHDLKYAGGEPGLVIGNNNVFREYTSIHTSTPESKVTAIGNHNYFLAFVHVGHECILGDHIVISCSSLLAGHVIVEDHVTFGGRVSVHQFCRIGAHAMLAAHSLILQDVLPFMLVSGDPATAKTINQVGMERSGFSSEERDLARSAYKTLYRNDLNLSQALEKLTAHPHANGPILRPIIDFARDSKRGLT